MRHLPTPPERCLGQLSATADFGQAFLGSASRSLSPLAASLPIAYIGQINLYTEHNEFEMLQEVAPNGQVTPYDWQNLPVYAELLDADASGMDWAEGARLILGLDVAAEGETARKCWESHLEAIN